MSATDEQHTEKGKKAAAAMAASAAIAAVAGQLLHEDANGADAAATAGRDPFDDLVPPPPVADHAAGASSPGGETTGGETTGTTVVPTPTAATAAAAVGTVAAPLETTEPIAASGPTRGDGAATGSTAPAPVADLADADVEPTSSTDPIEDVMAPVANATDGDDGQDGAPQATEGADEHDAPSGTATPVEEMPPAAMPVDVPTSASPESAPLGNVPFVTSDPLSTSLPQGVDGGDVVFGVGAASGATAPWGSSGGGDGAGAAGQRGPSGPSGPAGVPGAAGSATADGLPADHLPPAPIEVGAAPPLLVADPVLGSTPLTDEVVDDPFAAQRAAAMAAAAEAAEHNAAQLQSQADQQAFDAAQAQAQAALELDQQQSYAAELLGRAYALLQEQSIAAFASMTAQSFDLDDKLELWREIKVLNPSLTGGPQQLAPFVSQNATMEQIAEHFGVDITALAHSVALEANPQFTIADIVEERSGGAIDISADVIVVTVDGVDVLINADGNVTFDSGPEGTFQSMDFADVTPSDWDSLEGFAGLYHLPAD